MIRRAALVVLIALSGLLVAQEPKQIAQIATAVPLRAAAICGGGAQIVGIDRDRQAHIWEVATGRESHLDAGQGSRLTDVVCSPDGRKAAFATRSGHILIIDVATAKITADLEATKHFIQSMAVTNGSSAAVASDDGAPKLIELTTGKATELSKPFGATGAIAFSPDSEKLATADEDTKVRIYDSAGKLQATADCGPLEPSGLGFSADARQLFVAGVDGRVRTVDVATGHTIRTSENAGSPVLSIVLSGSRKNAALLLMDEYTMAPTEVVVWNASANSLRKSPIVPAQYIAASAGAKGWLLLKAEKSGLTVWELPE